MGEKKLNDKRLVELLDVYTDADDDKASVGEAADMARELLALRASHAKLLEALKSFPRYNNPNEEGECSHRQEWYSCDACRLAWETAVADWIQKRNAAAREAEKL